jgi:hypothetical protein
MKVSAIVSVYNGSRFIEGCLHDLLEQTLYKQGGLEIIIIDSASEENEKEIVSKFLINHRNIKYIRTEQRETLYGAWNRGVQEASCSFVTNANVDDRHCADAFEIHADYLEKNSEIDLVYADVFCSHQANATFDQSKQEKRYCYAPFRHSDVLFHYQFGCQPMWKRGIHDQVGFFDSAYRAAGDWEFNFRFNLAGKKAKHIHEVLGVFFENPDSLSRVNNASVDEQAKVCAKYINLDTIFALFQHEGISCATLQERATALRELSQRANRISLPWEPGQVFMNEGLSKGLLDAAIQFENIHQQAGIQK